MVHGRKEKQPPQQGIARFEDRLFYYIVLMNYDLICHFHLVEARKGRLHKVLKVLFCRTTKNGPNWHRIPLLCLFQLRHLHTTVLIVFFLLTFCYVELKSAWHDLHNISAWKLENVATTLNEIKNNISTIFSYFCTSKRDTVFHFFFHCRFAFFFIGDEIIRRKQTLSASSKINFSNIHVRHL